MKHALFVLITLLAASSPLTKASASDVEPDTYSFVLNSHPKVVDPSLQSAHYTIDAQIASRMGFAPLYTTWGASTYRPIAMMVWYADFDTPKTQAFLQALMREKKKLMDLYHLENDDYNRLAVMAFGIFGNESKFGDSHWYRFKDHHQTLVDIAKILKGRSGTNSRGGTQIKNIPKLILQAYPDITPDNLDDPRHSAIATVGFLADILHYLRATQAHQLKYGVKPGTVNLSYITALNIYDYIPYVYSGQMTKILIGPNAHAGATVVDNGYILNLKENVQAVTVWEYSR